jgi:hypothetical protein
MPIGDQQSTAPAFAAGTSFSRQDLRLPGQRDAWTYCVSPTRLFCLDGLILPELAKAWHTPGIQGNPPGTNRGQGFVGNMIANGYQPVPHDMACEAFGQSRAGSPVSTYLDRYEGVSGGRGVVYYSDAWHRPRQLGHLTSWEHDRDGWKAFLARCLDIVSPNGLVDLQVQLAVAPVLRRIRAAQDRDDARGRRMLLQLLSHLPAEHVPSDLADLVEESQPKPKTARRRKE